MRRQLAFAYQRHITLEATEEILCGRPHNSSYSQSCPSGSCSVFSSNIGVTKAALIFFSAIGPSLKL
jgi:hypothetical protein